MAWLANRGLTAKTICVYLAGIRQGHIVEGLTPPVIRTPLVNMVIDGKKHMDAFKSKTSGDKSRLPMTADLMKLLKEEIRMDNIDERDKLLLWTVAALAFNGGFRIHELLTRKASTFDPDFSLLRRDLSSKTFKVGKQNLSSIQVLIKSEKKDRIGAGTIVDVYESGGQICPVRAYKKWEKANPSSKKKRLAFLESSGKPLTGRRFNSFLKKYLSKYTAGTGRPITSHSFRSGLATMMGELGFGDDDIKAVGRWSSRCFEDYLKLPRTKRAIMAKKIGELGL